MTVPMALMGMGNSHFGYTSIPSTGKCAKCQIIGVLHKCRKMGVKTAKAETFGCDLWSIKDQDRVDRRSVGIG